MILKCLNDVRVPHNGYDYLFESTKDFGYVYEVDEELCQKAIATRQCQQIVVDEDHPYKGPTPEIPSRSGPGPASQPTEVVAEARETVSKAAAKAKKAAAEG